MSSCSEADPTQHQPVDVIFITQLVDPADDVLGFTIKLIRTLAANVRRVVVIANEVRSAPDNLGAEVLSLGKERGRGVVGRTARLAQLAVQVSRDMPNPVVLAHMCPEYVEAVAPVALLLRIPIVLWFTHPSDSARLGRALALSKAVLTVFPGSFPRSHRKVRAVGHAIDTGEFAFSEPEAAQPARFVCIGRTSPVKGYPLVIDAAAQVAGERDIKVTIVGSSTNAMERAHRTDLEARIRERGLTEKVVILPGVPHAQVSSIVGASRGLISATTAGSADKAVFEAMACGRPTIVSNPVFTPLLIKSPIELRFRPNDANSLAERLSQVAALGSAELADVGRALRAGVEREHSLAHWGREVAQTLAEVSRRLGA